MILDRGVLLGVLLGLLLRARVWVVGVIGRHSKGQTNGGEERRGGQTTSQSGPPVDEEIDASVRVRHDTTVSLKEQTRWESRGLLAVTKMADGMDVWRR